MNIQIPMFLEDMSNKRTLVSLSGGIDSMALLCYLATVYPEAYRPRELFIFYVHLHEHSPGTMTFVRAGLHYAREHFEHVTFGFHNAGSVLAFFRGEKMIPHPMFSPCSAKLKMEQINAFKEHHAIQVDLVGYLRSERRRINRALQRGAEAQGKQFLISHLVQQDAFDIVAEQIGWYPKIYDIKENGKRVFPHNNCLPCIHWEGRLDETCASGEFKQRAKYYPVQVQRAQALSKDIGAYWGRDKNFNGQCRVCEV